MSRWPIKRLVETADLTGSRVVAFAGQRTYVATGDLNENGIATAVPVSFDNRPSRADLAAREGDVLFARMQATNKVVIVTKENENYLWSTGFATLRPKTDVHPQWLAYWLASPLFNTRKDALCTGATQKAITNDGIRDLEIPLPPLSEQERYVQLLNETDQLRRLRANADQRADDLIASIYYEMIGDPLLNPKRWQQSTIGELTSFITSGSRGWAEHYSERGARFIRVQNLTGHRLGLDDVAYIDPPDTAEAKRTRIQPNDLLLAITGNTIGLSALAPANIGEAYVSQHVAIIRLKSKISPVFIACFIALSRGGQYHIAEMQYGHTKPGISLQQIRDIPIPLPPLSLQEEFATRIDEFRGLRAEQAACRQRLDDLFQSLLIRSFRGDL